MLGITDSLSCSREAAAGGLSLLETNNQRYRMMRLQRRNPTSAAASARSFPLLYRRRDGYTHAAIAGNEDKGGSRSPPPAQIHALTIGDGGGSISHCKRGNQEAEDLVRDQRIGPAKKETRTKGAPRTSFGIRDHPSPGPTLIRQQGEDRGYTGPDKRGHEDQNEPINPRQRPRHSDHSQAEEQETEAQDPGHGRSP